MLPFEFSLEILAKLLAFFIHEIKRKINLDINFSPF